MIRIKNFFKKSLHHLIPSSCLICGAEGEQLICAGCCGQFFSSTTKRCVSCALPMLIHDTRCGDCLATAPAFDATIVACDYAAPIDQLVLSLKFGHRLAVAPVLADLLAKVMVTSAKDPPDFLIPVPLSRRRLAQRGFNQALEIAKPLAHASGQPVYFHLVQRLRDTQAQTQLHPDQRYKNILHAFSPDPAYIDKIRGSHIGVVDDVMTTGATLNEVAICLKRHGAARVTNFVFARTAKSGANTSCFM